MNQPAKSSTRTLEELIRYRAEALPDIGLTLFPEAIVDLLDEKDNEILRLEAEMLEILKKQISLSGGNISNIQGLVL